MIEAACLASENHAVGAIDEIKGVFCLHDDASGDEPGHALAANAGAAVVRDGDTQAFGGFEHCLALVTGFAFPASVNVTEAAPSGPARRPASGAGLSRGLWRRRRQRRQRQRWPSAGRPAQTIRA